jgi:hypothetical protein
LAAAAATAPFFAELNARPRHQQPYGNGSERDLDITAPLFAAIKNPKPDNGRSPERITIGALARMTITAIAKIIIGQKQ